MLTSSRQQSTALLLARLEQENNFIVSNPKSGLKRGKNEAQRRGRPPSMQQLKQMVDGPAPPSLRYSLIQTPPMTDLEFYAALVQDYKRTAQRLPILLSKKIRTGIPPPLRGVVWQSMSGARDMLLEEEYDRLCGESSPYEGIIGKDLGRSFPGVEMFRDPDGDGQRMLGKVLKAFSLYDNKIGYCQGLGFLVGPLLMHMADRQAFCVLVRLIDAYDLRACFMPDLAGLHVRIYQFKELLKRHLTKLSKHLDHLQIEASYVSQWFLSFFAVTCPLPMLFRIYDVIFAEGASETIMRVALSVMRKNEEKILACTEFEDVMQLLLSRGLWDCYHMDADEFVNDFVSLTGIVTNEVLQKLESQCKESRQSSKIEGPQSDILSAGSRFLGRIWNSGSKSTQLNPAALAPLKKPASFMRRSGSKQSMASTLNSVEGSTDSMISVATTAATEPSRKSSNSDNSSVCAPGAVFPHVVSNQKAMSNTNKNLHSQIEDLLTALNEMQRDRSILMNQLQKVREDRDEDRHAVCGLIDVLKRKNSELNKGVTAASHGSLETVTPKSSAEIGTTAEVSAGVRAPLKGSLVDIPDENGIILESATRMDARKDSAKDFPDAEQEPKNTFPGVDASRKPSLRAYSVDESPHGTPRHIALQTPRKLSMEDAVNYLYDDEAFFSLIETVEERFSQAKRPRSSMILSKIQLRDDLASAQAQLKNEKSKSQDLMRKLHDSEIDLTHLREQIREGHFHIRNGLHEKNRLERLIQELRAKLSASASAPDGDSDTGDWQRRASVHNGGLRELKLGRNASGPRPGVFNKRSSSLHNVLINTSKENDTLLPSPRGGMVEVPPESPRINGQLVLTNQMGLPPVPTSRTDTDALIHELVQAKTAEAEARQEAEEATAKLESLKRLLNSRGDGNGHESKGSVNLSVWGLGRKDSETSVKPAATTPRSLGSANSHTPTSSGGGGGFWGWGKRTASLVGVVGEGPNEHK